MATERQMVPPARFIRIFTAALTEDLARSETQRVLEQRVDSTTAPDQALIALVWHDLGRRDPPFLFPSTRRFLRSLSERDAAYSAGLAQDWSALLTTAISAAGAIYLQKLQARQQEKSLKLSISPPGTTPTVPQVSPATETTTEGVVRYWPYLAIPAAAIVGLVLWRRMRRNPPDASSAEPKRRLGFGQILLHLIAPAVSTGYMIVSRRGFGLIQEAETPAPQYPMLLLVTKPDLAVLLSTALRAAGIPHETRATGNEMAIYVSGRDLGNARSVIDIAKRRLGIP